jgi:protein-S-isoprenylcysteine O-methyltransferase Ste14
LEVGGYLIVPWVIAVVVVSFFTDRSGVLFLLLADWVSYSVCALLGALGMSVLALGMKACPLRVISGRDASVLVTHGIYSYIRHPICLSCVFLAFSAAIGFKSVAGLMVAILALIAAYLHASLWEERELERRFGNEYHEYKRKVGMFIPKPSSTWKNFR